MTLKCIILMKRFFSPIAYLFFFLLRSEHRGEKYQFLFLGPQLELSQFCKNTLGLGRVQDGAEL